MSSPSRPITSWSRAISTTTRGTGFTNQTIPLVTVRRKLFRHKSLPPRRTDSKHDIEKIFKLYYSNDVKFDSFQQQIVTGTRIPTTKTISTPDDNVINLSKDTTTPKDSVIREPSAILGNESKPIEHETTPKSAVSDRTVQKSIINIPISSSHVNLSTPTVIVAVPNLPEPSSSDEQNELCDLPLVKSVTFLGDDFNNFHENMNTKKKIPNLMSRPISSKSSKSSSSTISPALAPPPSLMMMNDNNQKDPSISSRTSFSTVASMQKNRSCMITGPGGLVCRRTLTRQSLREQRSKSCLSSASKTRPLLIESDMPKPPSHDTSQRIVSIPSKCSRYVLVTFPEAHLRYSTPSYVERLLLPERFPTLFQNILQSHDHHLSNGQHHRKG